MLLEGLSGIKAQQEAALNLEMTFFLHTGSFVCVCVSDNIWMLPLLSLAWLELDAKNIKN